MFVSLSSGQIQFRYLIQVAQLLPEAWADEARASDSRSSDLLTMLLGASKMIEK